MHINSYLELENILKEHDHRELYDNENLLRYVKKHPIHLNFPIIHITGTNGKGSTLHYLEMIYEKMGYVVGSYVSPSHYRYLEMIRVNEKSIDEDIFIKLFNERIDEFIQYELTAFEMITLVMFAYFASIKLDVLLLEVGMGGEIDATNIIDTNELAIITSVSLEHTSYLGKTISEIAYNKAGILRDNKPYLIGEEVSEEARDAIRIRAKKLDAEEYNISSYKQSDEDAMHHSLSYGGHTYKYLGPKYGYHNLLIALEASHILNHILPVDFDELSAFTFKALDRRMEVLNKSPLIIFDGAHTPEAVASLNESIALFNKPVHIIFACLEDKNLPLLLEEFEKISHDIVLTTFNNKRARGEFDYFLYLEDFPFCEDYCSILHRFKENYPDDIILVSGSIAFIDEVRTKL